MPICQSSARAGCSTMSARTSSRRSTAMSRRISRRASSTCFYFLDHERQGLRLADRRLGARHVLQQGRFQKGGLWDAPPATWADFKAAAEKIKANGGGRVSFRPAGQGNRNGRLFLLRVLVLRRPDHQGRQVGPRQPGGDRCGHSLQGLHRRRPDRAGATSYNREDVQNLFKQGKVATVITAPFLSGQIKEAPNLNYGVAPFPPDRRETRAPMASPTRS